MTGELRRTLMPAETTGVVLPASASGRRLVRVADRVPVLGSDSLEPLGFLLGVVEADDPRFRWATLPPGWRAERASTTDDTWRIVRDQRALPRVALYEADRQPSCSVVDVGARVASDLMYGGEVRAAVRDCPWGVLTEQEREDCLAHLRLHVGRAGTPTGQVFRGEALLQLLRGTP